MSLLTQALELACKGYHVCPVAVTFDENAKKRLSFPGGSWKEHSTVMSDELACQPWDEATHIGINCEASGIVVVDLDAHDRVVWEAPDGSDSVNEPCEGEDLLREYTEFVVPGSDLTDPVTTASVSGKGYHLYYRENLDYPVASSVGKIETWVDVRGIGGFIICGEPGTLPEVDALEPAPEWLAEASKPSDHEAAPKGDPREPRYRSGENGTKWGLAGLEAEVKTLRASWEADEGNFNDTLNRAAFAVGQLVAGGELTEEHAYGDLDEVLTELGAPESQWKTLDSGFWSGFDRPRSAVDEAEGVTDDLADALHNEFVSEDDLIEFPPPQWLLPGWLERDSLAQLVGEPGAGKSFLALDWAACLSRGLGWPSRTAAYDPVRVWYVVAEGPSGMGQRMLAWRNEFSERASDRLSFLPRALQIKHIDFKVLVSLAKDARPDLIIFDTQARCTTGVEENSATEMGEVIDRLDWLRRETKACVLLVHHVNKITGTARGSSVMLGAMDTEIIVRRDKDTKIIETINTKQKNGENAEPSHLSLRKSGLSCVLDLQVQGLMTTEERNRLRREAFRVHGVDPIVDALQDLRGQDGVSVRALIGLTGKSDKTVRNRVAELAQLNLVTVADGKRYGTAIERLYSWSG